MIHKFTNVLGQKENIRNYKFTDSALAIICFGCRKRLKQIRQRHLWFQQSFHKLKEEMDVVSFIRLSRYLKALMEILITKREKKMVLGLRQLNLKQVENEQDMNKFLKYGKDGIDSVSTQYIKQFFSLYEVQTLIKDIKKHRVKETELSLLRHLGLGKNIDKLLEFQS